MKISLIIFTLLLGFILQCCDIIDSDNTNIQITPGDDSLISDSVKTLKREDASILALRDLHSNPASKESLIILPEEIVPLVVFRGITGYFM